MPGKWNIYTPEGVQDILFDDCYSKRILEGKLRELFKSWSYFEIETPVIEFYDVFSGSDFSDASESMFKFFDEKGRILVLRPDATTSAARMAATKLKDCCFPARISYIGNIFRYNEMGGGKQREFTQAGIEIFGASGPQTDAEIVAIAIEALLKAGLDNFQIDIGQVAFFKAIMAQSGLDAAESEKVRILIDKKDYFGVEQLMEAHHIDKAIKELILGFPGLFGSVEVLDRVEKQKPGSEACLALEHLRSILMIIEDFGYSKYVSVDLGMVQELDYYTGMIFKGFTHGVGFPVVSGGRYDNLAGSFGKDLKATGFSLGVNMLMSAVQRQKLEAETPSVDLLITCQNGLGKYAASIASIMRNQSLVVELDICGRFNLKDDRHNLKEDSINQKDDRLNQKDNGFSQKDGSFIMKDDFSEYIKARRIGGMLRLYMENNEKMAEVTDFSTSVTSIKSIDQLLGDREEKY